MKFLDLLKNSVRPYEEMTVSEADMYIKQEYLKQKILEDHHNKKAQLMANVTANTPVYATTLGNSANSINSIYGYGNQAVGVTNFTYPANTLGGGGGYTQQYTQQQAYFPTPITGYRTQYILVDAAGVQHSICIDHAHRLLIDTINNQNNPNWAAYIPNSAIPTPPKPPMQEGDFSLDEIGRAEKIIEEMAG